MMGKREALARMFYGIILYLGIEYYLYDMLDKRIKKSKARRGS